MDKAAEMAKHRRDPFGIIILVSESNSSIVHVLPFTIHYDRVPLLDASYERPRLSLPVYWCFRPGHANNNNNNNNITHHGERRTASSARHRRQEAAACEKFGVFPANYYEWSNIQ